MPDERPPNEDLILEKIANLGEHSKERFDRIDRAIESLRNDHERRLRYLERMEARIYGAIVLIAAAAEWLYRVIFNKK